MKEFHIPEYTVVTLDIHALADSTAQALTHSRDQFDVGGVTRFVTDINTFYMGLEARVQANHGECAGFESWWSTRRTLYERSVKELTEALGKIGHPSVGRYTDPWGCVLKAMGMVIAIHTNTIHTLSANGILV